MKSLESLGAAGEVSGSSHLLTTHDNNQVMIDFGMFQGSDNNFKKNYDKPVIDPNRLKGIFITHAHLDHCGRLGLLPKMGFRGKIYMTEPTAAILPILLNDTVKIASYDINPPLYSKKDVDEILNNIETFPYNQRFNVENLSAVFRDAGHILGSSSLELTEKNGETIVFSGDLGNSSNNLLHPPAQINNADIVVVESTYGDRNHPDEDPKVMICDYIKSIEKRGEGTLLIPAFAIHKTQELLHIIHNLKKQTKIKSKTPVFLDSPMALRVTNIYRDYINSSFFSDELARENNDPLNFNGLYSTWTATDSRKIFGHKEPKIIISSSGMMSGGRVRKHAMNYLPDKASTILFVGYQAENTLGREILEGEKQVYIDDEFIPVRANISRIQSLSAHADQNQLLNWLSSSREVRKVCIIHGDTPQRLALSEKINQELGIYDVILPLRNQQILL